MSGYKDYGYTDVNSAHAHKYLLHGLLPWLDPEKNRYILDLGCGNGAIVHQLIAKGFNAYGTDASESGIKLAEEINPGRFGIQDLSSDELPALLANIPFDTIISTEVIEHLYDPGRFIAFCSKILAKNGSGELIISTPYHGYLKNLMLSAFAKWDKHADPLWDGGHIKLWSDNTLTKLITRYGFKKTGFKGCGRIPYLWKSMLIKGTLTIHE